MRTRFQSWIRAKSILLRSDVRKSASSSKESLSPRPPLQAKLTVNPPDDRYEQEADQAAEQALRVAQPRMGLPADPGGHPTTGPDLETQVGALRQDGGQSLPEETRAFFEPRLGHDFGQVRVHADSSAAVTAKSLNARAFTVGRDIVFGSGQYAPEMNEGKRLLAHELVHTIQQRAGIAGLAVQRDVIDDVREKLSYGVIDWEITDADAMEALALLGTIPPANLANALTRLEPKYVTRLLDNLPDAAKTGALYQRVVEALGPAAITPYATEQLSYGLFDWAITDAEVTRVFNTFTNLPAAQQEPFLAGLNARGYLGRLISNSHTGHHALYIRPWISTLAPRGALSQQRRDILRMIVQETPNDVFDTLKLATEIRFNVTVGQTTIPDTTPADWNPALLRQAYLILDELPEAHVAGNRELLRLGQFREAASGGRITAGMYSPAQRELALNIEATGDVRDTVVHETGHAVDEEMGWSAGPEPARPERGGWTTYGVNYQNCATAMVNGSGGAITTSLTPAQRQDVIDEMDTAMGNRSAQGLEAAIRALPWFGGLPEATRETVLADRALAALRIGLNQPWFNASDGGEHLGDHVYQESYPNTWVRYRHEARARRVSNYQFRDAGEWFAEAYEFYYRPDRRGRGMKLADRDPNTKTYFDNNVHNRARSR